MDDIAKQMIKENADKIVDPIDRIEDLVRDINQVSNCVLTIVKNYIAEHDALKEELAEKTAEARHFYDDNKRLREALEKVLKYWRPFSAGEKEYQEMMDIKAALSQEEGDR